MDPEIIAHSFLAQGFCRATAHCSLKVPQATALVSHCPAVQCLPKGPELTQPPAEETQILNPAISHGIKSGNIQNARAGRSRTPSGLKRMN